MFSRLSLKFFYLIILVIHGPYLNSYAQDLFINEYMASNSGTIPDEDGDYSDWIEIYNAGPLALNLKGFGLTDNESNLHKWKFPDKAIQPQEFLLIWASGKDKGNVNHLHTNFNISASGEPLILSNPEGIIVDKIDAKEIPTDHSYGRSPDGSTNFLFFINTTPGQKNESNGFSEILNPPQFSVDGGFFNNGFNLTIDSHDPSATIIYTLDGSDPDPENISGTTYQYKNSYPYAPGDGVGSFLENSFKSHIYSGPISIIDRSGQEDKLARISTTYHSDPWYIPATPVFKGTVVKAISTKEGALPSSVVTNSYFINAKGADRYTVPVISFSVREDALFDYYTGIYVAGKDFDDWRAQYQFGAADGGRPANYKRSGDEWEYQGHLEVFEPLKGRVLSEGAGVRVHGGYSNSHQAKSLRFYARSQYGASHFNYAFFPDLPFSAYKRILLRNSGNDFGYTHFRDGAIQAIVGHMNFETMAFRPSVLFINGEYWGIHNIRERFDKYYFETKYGVDPENIDILEGNAWPDEGDASHYNATIDYINSNGAEKEEHYEYIKTRIDVTSFIDYQIAQIFIANEDWPGNNIKFWRLKTSQYVPDAPEGHDGRWRWMMYDTDFGFGLYNSNAFATNSLVFATEANGPGWPNPPWSTHLFRALLKNQSFRNEFINRFTDQLNSAFKPEVMKEKINKIAKIVEPEIAEQIHRWDAPRNLSTWNNRVDVMLDFAEKRPSNQRNHLKSFFKLSNTYQLTVDVSHKNHGHVRVNSLDIKQGTPGVPDNAYPWTGSYFGGVPIELEAIPAPGYAFSGWVGAGGASTEKVTLSPSGNTSVKALFVSLAPTLIHYWNFNDADNFLLPAFSASVAHITLLKGENTETELITGTGNGFAGENSRFNDEAESHLRINNPIGSELILNLSTKGFSEVNLFKFEAKRSGQGPGIVIIEYSLDGSTFIEKEQISISDDDPIMFSLDFYGIESVYNNENFTIKLKFDQGEGGITGNARFDNITLEGVPMEIVSSVTDDAEKLWKVEMFPNPFENESNLRITIPSKNSVKIVVRDLKGTIHKVLPEYDLVPGSNDILLELNGISKGIYLLHFQFQNYKEVKKVVKM